jgi:hypothetical protein
VHSIQNLGWLKTCNKKYSFDSDVISPPAVRGVCPENAQLFKEHFLHQTCTVPDNILSDTDHSLQHLCAEMFINGAYLKHEISQSFIQVNSGAHLGNVKLLLL